MLSERIMVGIMTMDRRDEPDNDARGYNGSEEGNTEDGKDVYAAADDSSGGGDVAIGIIRGNGGSGGVIVFICHAE